MITVKKSGVQGSVVADPGCVLRLCHGTLPTYSHLLVAISAGGSEKFEKDDIVEVELVDDGDGSTKTLYGFRVVQCSVVEPQEKLCHLVLADFRVVLANVCAGADYNMYSPLRVPGNSVEQPDYLLIGEEKTYQNIAEDITNRALSGGDNLNVLWKPRQWAVKGMVASDVLQLILNETFCFMTIDASSMTGSFEIRKIGGPNKLDLSKLGYILDPYRKGEVGTTPFKGATGAVAIGSTTDDPDAPRIEYTYDGPLSCTTITRYEKLQSMGITWNRDWLDILKANIEAALEYSWWDIDTYEYTIAGHHYFWGYDNVQEITWTYDGEGLPITILKGYRPKPREVYYEPVSTLHYYDGVGENPTFLTGTIKKLEPLTAILTGVSGATYDWILTTHHYGGHKLEVNDVVYFLPTGFEMEGGVWKGHGIIFDYPLVSEGGLMLGYVMRDGGSPGGYDSGAGWTTCSFTYSIYLQEEGGDPVATGVTPDTARIANVEYTTITDRQPALIYQDEESHWHIYHVSGEVPVTTVKKIPMLGDNGVLRLTLVNNSPVLQVYLVEVPLFETGPGEWTTWYDNFLTCE